MYKDFWFKKSYQSTSQTTSTGVCVNDGQVPTSMTEGCTVTIMNGKSKGDGCRKLQTNCFPSTDVEIFDKNNHRSNVWTFE